MLCRCQCCGRYIPEKIQQYKVGEPDWDIICSKCYKKHYMRSERKK